MKKKIFGGIAVLAFAAIVGLNVKMNADKNQISDLGLANVEALANESTTVTIPCLKEDNKTCYFLMKDAAGNSYTASTSGFKHT